MNLFVLAQLDQTLQNTVIKLNFPPSPATPLSNAVITAYAVGMLQRFVNKDPRYQKFFDFLLGLYSLGEKKRKTAVFLINFPRIIHHKRKFALHSAFTLFSYWTNSASIHCSFSINFSIDFTLPSFFSIHSK